MTDHPAPITDEDLSAHLDGQAAPDMAQRIAADPEAQNRLEALRDAARTVADAPVPALDGATVDRLVGRALLVFDEAHGPTDPVLTPIASTQRSSSVDASDAPHAVRPYAPQELVPPAARRRLPPTWLVAAAVVLVVALGIGLVVTGRDRDRSDQGVNTALTESTDRDQGAASKSGEASADASAPQPSEHGGASGAAPSTTIGPAFAAGAVDLGRFDTAQALRTALATRFPDAPATASSGGAPVTAAVQRCGTQVLVALNLKSNPTHIGYATVGGRQVLVYEFATTSYTDETPTTLIAAVGTQACDPVVTFQR